MAKQITETKFVSVITQEMWMMGWRVAPPNDHLNKLYQDAYEKKKKPSKNKKKWNKPK